LGIADTSGLSLPDGTRLRDGECSAEPRRYTVVKALSIDDREAVERPCDRKTVLGNRLRVT
jgi:hypothetical protein